jgi:hypothetical protein
MFSLQVKAAVKLASGKISAHGTGNVFLDCTSTGNHARCASQPHLGGAGTSGCNETRTDCVAHGGGGTGGTSTGLKICTPGQQSVPGAANDPCPQICTGPSYAICGVEGMWGECMCSDGSGGSGGSSVCGNNVRESVEQCDGADLNAATCSTLGLGNGILLCDPATCTYDSSMCNSAARDAGSSGGPDASMTTTDGGVSQCPPSWHCDTSVGACVQDGSNVPGGCNATCTQYSGSCSDPYCIILCG